MKKSTQGHFESVYKKLALPLTKFVIKRMGGSAEAVDEVLAATMIAGWRGWKTFRHKSSYFTWLCRIALNKMADYYRDQVNTRSRFIVPNLKNLANIDSKDIKPEEKLILDELRARVNECLNLLPPGKRKLLQFRFWYDLSYNQISKILGISERAVEGQLYRAKSEFAKVWTHHSTSVVK